MRFSREAQIRPRPARIANGMVVTALFESWRQQRRIISALFMRDIVGRWGRENFGFAWLFLEPLVFILPVLFMWRTMRGPIEHGLPLIALLWSGYVPLLMFRHVTMHALRLISSDVTLLYHRIVTPLDLFIGRCGLEALGNITSLVTSFIVLHAVGALPLPYDYPLLLTGVFFMAWWTLSVAMIVTALSERFDLVVHIWAPISYIYLPVSGAFYLAEWIPTGARNLALTFIPPLHSHEMIRAGLFGSQIKAYYDVSYLSYFLLIFTAIGLWLMRHVRKHLDF